MRATQPTAGGNKGTATSRANGKVMSEGTHFTSAIRIHAPKVVLVISSVYPTPFIAAKEAVQNAIDAGAKRVEVIIDLYANRKPEERCIVVRDNGKGLDRKEFAEKMANVGRSDKAADQAKLGRHGLGLMSFLGKARHYVFTSGPKATKAEPDWEGYTAHYFAREMVKGGQSTPGGIEERGDELIVPATSMPDLTKAPKWWNTEVTVKGFAVQRLSIPLDALEDDVRSDFNLAMLEYGTEIVVTYVDARGKTSTRTINARNYSGQRFKHHAPRGQHCGRTTFDMYRLQQPTGVVTLKTQQDSYTKDWKKMREAAVAQGMSKELAEALGSGYLEGVITVENCEWDFDRRGFKPTDELAWIELVMMIIEWLDNEDVKRHLREVLGRKEEQREFDLLNRLKQHFDQLYGQDADLLYEPLANLPLGMGTAPSAGKDSGATGKAAGKPPGKVVRTEAEPKKPGQRGDKGERKPTHFSVEEGQGNARFVSKAGGLMFGIRSIGSFDYYEWDLSRGILVINRDHPYYQAIKESEEKVWAYFLGIAEWAVCLLMVDEAAYKAAETSLRQVEKQHQSD